MVEDNNSLRCRVEEAGGQVVCVCVCATDRRCARLVRGKSVSVRVVLGWVVCGMLAAVNVMGIVNECWDWQPKTKR